jgi:hypothetical protein
MNLLELIWGGLLYGGTAMAITRTAFYVFGGRSTTESKEFPKNIAPWVAEYLAFTVCVGYALHLFDGYIS